MTASHAKRAPVQARSREKLERLLTVGAAMVAENGFEALRLADVAKAADCSVGIIYQRFADKDAFLLALRDRFCAEFTATTDQAVSQVDAGSYSSFELMAYVIANHVQIFRANRGFLTALAHRGMVDAAAWAPIRRLADHVAGIIAGLIARRDDVGCADPRGRTLFAMQMIHSTLLMALTGQFGPHGIDDPDLVRRLVSMAARVLDLRTRRQNKN